MNIKECTICHELKDENEFYYTKIKKKGVYEPYIMPYCKECNKTKSNAWRIEHLDYTRAAVLKADKLENRAKRNKEWRKTQKYRDWCDNNRDKLNGYSHQKHEITTKEWDFNKNYFSYECAYCGISEKEAKLNQGQNLHREHIDHNGSNGIDNCIPSCKKCNSSKRQHSMIEWYSKQPFYSEERLDKIIKWIAEDYKLITQ